MINKLAVKTHTSRAILATGALFNTAAKVIWEYVTNSRQYKDEGTIPHVNVTITKNKITIKDNGRGMDSNDIDNFLTLHGENADLIRGKKGRGRFGTGKSAFLGIADTLEVTSTKNKNQIKFLLTRQMIENVKDGGDVSVEMIHNKMVDEKNGTCIEIRDINLKNNIQISRVVDLINQNLVYGQKDKIFVNGLLCEPYDISSLETHNFIPENEPLLEGSELVIKISASPIDTPNRYGINIIANGDLYETTLADAEGKEFSNYIFGEFNIPTLLSESKIPAFDQSRSTKLNRENEVVSLAMKFLNEKIEIVRKILVERHKEKKKTEQDQKFASEANKIAQIINNDYNLNFSKIMDDIKRVKNANGNIDSVNDQAIGDDDKKLVPGNDIAAKYANPIENSDGKNNNQDLNINNELKEASTPIMELDVDQENKKAKLSEEKNKIKKNGSIFNVEFDELGQDEYRARYDNNTSTIIINLDHPQLAAALEFDGIDNPSFRKLTYEIAFVEYALNLEFLLVNTDEHYYELTEPLANLRTTMTRITRAASFLYR